MKTFNNYSELATHLMVEKGLKVNTHYGTEYNEHAVYIPRIYNSNYRKAKIRVLRSGDSVKNCLKITFDPYKHDKKYIERLIESNIRVIQNQLHGSCQTFLTVNNLAQVLTGVVGANGLPTQEAKDLLKGICS